MNIDELAQQQLNKTFDEIKHEEKYAILLDTFTLQELLEYFIKDLAALFRLYERDNNLNSDRYNYSLKYWDSKGISILTMFNMKARIYNLKPITSYSLSELTCLAKYAVKRLYNHRHEL